MSEYNAYCLSKLPKEILIKILLQKDNSAYFDLSYCYTMRDNVVTRIEKLKTEMIKRKLLEHMEDQDFICNRTRIRSSNSTGFLKFEYLNYKIAMNTDEIHVTLNGKPVYSEIEEEVELNLLTFELNHRVMQLHRVICKKIDSIYTVFDNISWFLDNDKLNFCES